jgi:hypothetical protein
MRGGSQRLRLDHPQRKARLRLRRGASRRATTIRDAFEPKRAALQLLSYRFLEARGALHETILDD